MNSVWILQVDYSPSLRAFKSEQSAALKYDEHIKSRMPGLEDDSQHTEFYDQKYNGIRHRSCYYDGSFVASLIEIKVED